MGWLANLILGLPGIAGKLLDYLGKRSDNTVLTNGQDTAADVTVAQARLTAYVEERKIIAAERAKLSESLWTAWMIPTAFALCIIHFGAIVLDSVGHFNWAVAKLPTPYDTLQINIIVTVVGIKTGAVALTRIFRR